MDQHTIGALFGCLWAISVPGMIGLVFYVAYQQHKRFKETLERVAQSTPGVRVVDAGFGRMELGIAATHFDGTVAFSAGGKNRPAYTRLEARTRGRCPTFSVRTQHLFSGIAKFFGAQDLEIGVPDFDGRWMISAESPDLARRLLGPDLRGVIDDLSGFSHSVSVDVMGERVHVRVGRMLRDETAISRFLADARAIVDAVSAPEGGGAPSAGAAGGQDGCLLCGAPRPDRPVRCRRCGAVHHEECWGYLGTCAAFGCGETRFLRR